MEVFGDATADPAYASRYASRRQATLKAVKKVAAPGATVLDVAAAQGNFSIQLAEDGFRVTWNDLREGLIEYVKLKYPKGNFKFRPGNVFEVAEGRYFDLVFATEIIEHVAHPDQFLQRLAEFVAPGGHIVLTTPNGRFLRNDLPRFSECPDPSQYEDVQFKPNADGHIFLLHPDEMDGLAHSAGLKLVELELITDVFEAGFLGTSVLHRRRSLLPLASFGGGIAKRLPTSLRSRVMTGMLAVFERPSE